MDAERALFAAGFDWLRSNLRVTVPFHRGEILHPRIVKQVVATLGEASQGGGTAGGDRGEPPE